MGAAGSPLHDTGAMGFDPTRPQRRRPSDLAFVVAGLLVAVGLVVWALLG